MNNDLHFSTGNDETATPWPFFLELNREFNFVCDVAATKLNAKVSPYFGPDHSDPTRVDCLTVDWPTNGWVYLNPPYSDPEFACKVKCKKKVCEKRGFHDPVYRPGCLDFVRKAAEQRLRGVSTVLLLASRTDTKWWHEHVYCNKSNAFRDGVEARFIRGRLKFEGHTQSAPFPSVVVIFRAVGSY